MSKWFGSIIIDGANTLIEMSYSVRQWLVPRIEAYWDTLYEALGPRGSQFFGRAKALKIGCLSLIAGVFEPILLGTSLTLSTLVTALAMVAITSGLLLPFLIVGYSLSQMLSALPAVLPIIGCLILVFPLTLIFALLAVISLKLLNEAPSLIYSGMQFASTAIAYSLVEIGDFLKKTLLGGEGLEQKGVIEDQIRIGIMTSTTLLTLAHGLYQLFLYCQPENPHKPKPDFRPAAKSEQASTSPQPELPESDEAAIDTKVELAKASYSAPNNRSAQRRNK